jgi:hypothetical protein
MKEEKRKEKAHQKIHSWVWNLRGAFCGCVRCVSLSSHELAVSCYVPRGSKQDFLQTTHEVTHIKTEIGSKREKNKTTKENMKLKRNIDK